MPTVNGKVIAKWALDHALEVEYTLANLGNEPLVLFDADPPYVLPQENGKLTLAMAWMPIPEGTLVEEVQKPPALKLAAKGEVKRTARIPLPIRQAPAYDTFDVKRPPVERDSTQLQLLVGYVQDGPGLALEPASFRGAAVQAPAVAFDKQLVAFSQAVPLKVPMRFRLPVPFPFPVRPPGPLAAVTNARETLMVKYTLRNNTSRGLYCAIPDQPVLSVENDTQLHIRMGPPPDSPRGAPKSPPLPATYLAPRESLAREVLIEQPVYSDRRPLVPFPPDWRGSDVRTTGIRFTQAWWEGDVAAPMPGQPAVPPATIEVPPAAFVRQQAETFFDDTIRALLWRVSR